VAQQIVRYAVEDAVYASREVVMAGGVLGGGENLSLVQIVDDGISIGAAAVHSQA
jgi:hypothetical protein